MSASYRRAIFARLAYGRLTKRPRNAGSDRIVLAHTRRVRPLTVSFQPLKNAGQVSNLPHAQVILGGFDMGVNPPNGITPMVAKGIHRAIDLPHGIRIHALS
jgi:hypothetical protein